MYIDSENDSGDNIDSFMQSIDSVTSVIKGFVRLTNKLDSTQFLLFQITDLTDNTGWWTIDITNQAYSEVSPFIDGEDVLVSFVTSAFKNCCSTLKSNIEKEPLLDKGSFFTSTVY